MSGVHTFRLTVPTGSVEEVLELHQREHGKHGNDLDLLVQAMMLFQAGHYRESVLHALRVMPTTEDIVAVPETVDKAAAQSAFLDALERARPLHEQAAFEIEGFVEGSYTMATYEIAAEMLRNDPNW